MGIKIKSSDLQYSYSKKAVSGDNPKIRDKADSNLFNKNEEYEVIAMLERLMDYFDTTNEEHLNGLEDIIYYDLPSNVRKRDDVFSWIIDAVEDD